LIVRNGCGPEGELCPPLGEPLRPSGQPIYPIDAMAAETTLLSQLVAAHIRADPTKVCLRRCMTGKHNETYFVDAGDRPLVLRVAPPDDPAQMLFYEYRMMRQEPNLHRLLRERTAAPVPEIIAFDDSHERIDRDYLIMERMPGTPLSDHAGLTPGMLENVLRQVGQSLRQVHAITGQQYGYVGEHRPMDPQSDWASAFAIMWNKLLDDIRGCGGYSDEEADFLRRRLDRHVQVFDRPVAASLLHMDVWAQNILADEEGRLTGLLDWDRALWGDPEIEFAVLDYCGISEPAFWEGYGAERDRSPTQRSAARSTFCTSCRSTSSSAASAEIARTKPSVTAGSVWRSRKHCEPVERIVTRSASRRPRLRS
jgi:aminoglycoside phosphotransferase (APT) family kinase protein